MFKKVVNYDYKNVKKLNYERGFYYENFKQQYNQRF